MLSAKWIRIISVFFVWLLCVGPLSYSAADEANKIGILPFSKLVSSAVENEIGISLKDELVTALNNQEVVVFETQFPAGQVPFTYEEMEAPAFEIDPDDFATPEQILSELSSQHGFDEVIFGHLEEVSDSLYLVVRVYSASSNKIILSQEEKLKTTGLQSTQVAEAVERLAVVVKEMVQGSQVVLHSARTEPSNILDEPNSGDEQEPLESLSDDRIVSDQPKAEGQDSLCKDFPYNPYKYKWITYQEAQEKLNEFNSLTPPYNWHIPTIQELRSISESLPFGLNGPRREGYKFLSSTSSSTEGENQVLKKIPSGAEYRIELDSVSRKSDRALLVVVSDGPCP